MSWGGQARAKSGDSGPTVRNDDPSARGGDDGFMLLTAIVMIFIVLLVLSVAAPTVAREIQHDRELESQHRAQQYVRAVRIFYLKFKRYPTSIEQLEKTNNQRFLRQRYVDPLTGKSDWRIIHVGENQTKVKGFFGEDLPGLPAMSGGGLGSAAGIQSNLPGAPATGGSAFNNSGIGGAGAGGAGATAGSGTGTGAFGQTGGTGTTAGAGAGKSTGTGSSNGIASQDATTFTGSGGGQVIGVGSARSGEAMLVVNEQTSYETWEFLYDPRIEQLYAKGTLLGGIASGSGTSGGFGTPIGNTPTTGTGFGGNGVGGTPTTPPVVGTPVQP